MKKEHKVRVRKLKKSPDAFGKAASFARGFVKGLVDYLDNVKEKIDAVGRGS